MDWEPYDEDEELAPPELFCDRRAPENVRPTHHRWRLAPGVPPPCCFAFDSAIAGNCCGWVEMPTAEELHAAIHAEDPDERQKVIIAMWWREATDDQLLDAWAEQAYTWRELAAAVHRAEAAKIHRERNHAVNGLTTAPWNR